MCRGGEVSHERASLLYRNGMHNEACSLLRLLIYMCVDFLFVDVALTGLAGADMRVPLADVVEVKRICWYQISHFHRLYEDFLFRWEMSTMSALLCSIYIFTKRPRHGVAI